MIRLNTLISNRGYSDDPRFHIKKGKKVNFHSKSISSTNIKDYYDRDEIERTIQKLNKTSDKMRLIDEILQERKRIEKRNKRVRIESMLPSMYTPKNGQRNSILASVSPKNGIRSINDEPKIQSFFKKMNLAKEMKQKTKFSLSTNRGNITSNLYTIRKGNHQTWYEGSKGKSINLKISPKNPNMMNKTSIQTSEKRGTTRIENQIGAIKKKIIQRVRDFQNERIKKEVVWKFKTEVAEFENKL